MPNPFVGVTGCLRRGLQRPGGSASARRWPAGSRLLFSFPEAVPLRWTDANVTEATMAGYTQVSRRFGSCAGEEPASGLWYPVPSP